MGTRILYSFVSESIGCSVDVGTNAFEIGQILNASCLVQQKENP